GKMNLSEGVGGGEPEHTYGPKSEMLGSFIHTNEGWFQLQIVEEGWFGDKKGYVPTDPPPAGTYFWEKDYNDPEDANGSFCIKGDGIDTNDVYLSDPDWQEKRSVKKPGYTQYLENLGFKESSNRYHIKNEHGYLGKYQMGLPALHDAGFYDIDNGTWTDKSKEYGVSSEDGFLNSPEAQEAAIREYHKALWRQVCTYGYDKYIGTEVHGIKVTASGLIAGSHLVGAKGLGKLFGEHIDVPVDDKGIPIDGNKTKSTNYMKEFGGLDLTELVGYNPDK
ncbi:hypothetical protein LJC10_06455, partial [Selenomonadales bacterium OttesenSCG-928-I06]|nr:hypothetical protein [Selenomonadales bacterium OttesenSCG-928-I06]